MKNTSGVYLLVAILCVLVGCDSNEEDTTPNDPPSRPVVNKGSYIYYANTGDIKTFEWINEDKICVIEKSTNVHTVYSIKIIDTRTRSTDYAKDYPGKVNHVVLSSGQRYLYFTLSTSDTSNCGIMRLDLVDHSDSLVMKSFEQPFLVSQDDQTVIYVDTSMQKIISYNWEDSEYELLTEGEPLMFTLRQNELLIKHGLNSYSLLDIHTGEQEYIILDNPLNFEHTSYELETLLAIKKYFEHTILLYRSIQKPDNSRKRLLINVHTKKVIGVLRPGSSVYNYVANCCNCFFSHGSWGCNLDIDNVQQYYWANACYQYEGNIITGLWCVDSRANLYRNNVNPENDSIVGSLILSSIRPDNTGMTKLAPDGNRIAYLLSKEQDLYRYIYMYELD